MPGRNEMLRLNNMTSAGQRTYISEHKKAIKQLKDLNTALNQACIVAIANPAGDITYVNDKFCEISKYSKEELLGSNHRILKSGRHSAEFYEDLWKTISSGNVWQGEIQNRAKDGSLYWVLTTIVPFFNEKGALYQYMSIRSDITKSKEADEIIEAEHAKTMYAEKMASLGEMAAGISHELGNPMGALRGRAELMGMLLDAGTLTEDKMRSGVENVVSLVDRMERIIRSMRSLSRDGSNDPFEPVDIKAQINDLIEFNRVRNQKLNIEVRKVWDKKINANVRCRETQISQVFVNLLNNARDAVLDSEDRWIEVDIVEEADLLSISVTDSGPGIPKEKRLQIMQPFFTTKDPGKGTGLGLSISRTIMTNHSGSLELDEGSERTRFVVKIPRTQHK